MPAQTSSDTSQPAPHRRARSLARAMLLGLAALLGLWLMLSRQPPAPALAGATPTYVLVKTYINPTPAENEEFGSAVTWLSPDDRVVIGAPGDTLTGAVPVGAVYILDRSTGSILHVLNKPSPAEGDQFGVAISAVLTQVVVGAPNVDVLSNTLVSNAGAAYLFDTETGGLIRSFVNPNPVASDYFGKSVAVLTDTVVAGVPQYNVPGAPDAGRVYVCAIATGACGIALDNPSPVGGDQFGLAVAAVGQNLVIGAPFDGSHGTVYVYNGSFTLTRVISETMLTSGDNFGRALAAIGDKILIGAPYDDTGAVNAGSAYLYDLDGNLVQTFTNPDPGNSDFFGSSVAGVGNLVLIGAPNDDTGGVDAGSAYLFDATTGALIRAFQKTTVSAGEQFGSSVAAAADNFLVGAHLDNTGSSQAGAAYLFGIPTVQPFWYIQLPLVSKP